MTDYDKLRELAENATPGPWEMVLPTENEASVYNSTSDEPIAWEQDWHHAGVFARQDGEFIAAANPQAILNLLEDLRITRAERDAEKHKNMQAAKDNAADHRAWQEVVTVARADAWDEGYVDGYFDAKENHHKGPDEALRRTPNPYWKDTK